MSNTKPNISVCICTYKRPEMLKRLLSKFEKLQTEGLFYYSIVIVDNDRLASGCNTVEAWRSRSKVPVDYYLEPEQNIALARNRAIENARGDYIALIDDDEFPEENWLINHYNALILYQSDGVLGPVLPLFDSEPPAWVTRGHFFDRPTHPTGHVMEWSNSRSGNALLKKELFAKNTPWFDPAFGSGGEDRAFFRKKIDEGCIFIWCNDARVFELIPARRWNRSVLLKRGLIRGRMALNAAKNKPASVLKSLIALLLYTLLMPLNYVSGYHHFMHGLIKCCDHFGKVISYLGVDVVKQKYIGG